MRPKSILVIGLVVCSLWTLVPPCLAAPVGATWLGGTDSWFTASRWSGGVVPINSGANTYNVKIDGGNAVASIVNLVANDVHLDITVDSLTVDAGDEFRMAANVSVGVPGASATLRMNNGLTVNGRVHFSANNQPTSIVVGANQTITGSGSFTAFGSNTNIGLRSASGNLTIDSQILINAEFATRFSMFAPGELTFNGTARAVGGAGFLNGESITNHGTMIANQSFIDVATSASPTTFTSDGLIASDTRSLFRVYGATTIDDGGVVSMNLGAPHANPEVGGFTFNGDLDLSSLTDSLQLATTTGFNPSLTYTLVRYTGTLTGQFNQITPGFEAIYTTPGVISVRAVPEPGGVLGIVATSATLRRRRMR